MVFELRHGSCYPKALVGVNVALACVDSAIAVLAFYQLIRIHARDSHRGWTRQKVFHLMIGSSNIVFRSSILVNLLNVIYWIIGVVYRALYSVLCLTLFRKVSGYICDNGYFVYFVLSLVASCKGWLFWSNSCGFVFMAFPKILFLAAFLLLLSFWVDLCHQANDEDDEDEECSPQEALLEGTSNKPHPSADSRIRCFSFRSIPVGSRQKVVIFVTALIFILMIASAVLIWIGMGKNPIDSAVVARVYKDLFAIVILFLGGALACYGLVLFLKMRKVRSEGAASEMQKVAGLAIVSVLCFTSSAFVAIFTDIPMLYYWHDQHVNSFYTSFLLVLYYFIGSSVPSAFLLWVMRELPPSVVANVQESTTIAFIHDSSATMHPQRWTATASSQNQVLRASPI